MGTEAKHTLGLWYWGPDWDEAVRGREGHEHDEFSGMKYADLALYCGDETVIPLRLDHYGEEWDVDNLLSQPSAEKRAFIVRACNAHKDLLAALKKMLKVQGALMPGLAHIAVEDYALLNDAPLEAQAAIAKAEA